MDNHIIVNELFEYFPIKMDFIGSCAGYPVYSNDSIKEASLDWVSRSPITKNIITTISDGVDANQIMIGFTNKSTLSFLKSRFKIGTQRTLKNWFGWNLFGMYGNGLTLGLFSKEEGNIAIFLDPSVNIFGKVLMSLPAILAHELCHKTASSDIKNYLNHQMNPRLIPYYKNLFQLAGNLDLSGFEEKLKQTIVKVTLSSERKSTSILMENVVDHWKDFLLQVGLSGDELDSAIYKVFIPFYHYILEEPLSGLPNDLRNRQNEFQEFFYQSYDQIGVEDTRTTTSAGQEAVFTSEVVSISNEWGLDSVTTSMINKLKFK